MPSMSLSTSCPPPSATIFPYTTLFRSDAGAVEGRLEHGQRLRPQLVQRAVPVDPGAQVHRNRSEEHTSELQSLRQLVCRLLPEKKKSHTGTSHDRARQLPGR